MKLRFFGTDGVRGPYGGDLINEDFAARLGFAAARHFCGTLEPGARVVLGRDTRASGESLLEAVSAGVAAAGCRPLTVGVLPTPAVSCAVLDGGAAFGVMLTASHNPAADNGIKFFNSLGQKPSAADEAQIEALLPPVEQVLGTNRPAEMDGRGPYLKRLRAVLADSSLAGWTIALDTAHGAACATSRQVLEGLGATLVTLGDAPDGRNINDGVGSEHPEKLQARVSAAGARLGIAQDGDGDRCVLVDEKGVLLDGDEILAVLAVDALSRGLLANRTLVVTVQSNLGLDRAVEAAGGRVCRTPVGDRNVAERMRAEGAMLGGESSGHVICSDIVPTGDGLVAALRVIGVMLATGKPLSELRRVLVKAPQLSRALAVREKLPLDDLPNLRAEQQAIERELGTGGRLLVRYSGTEPKLRLLVEGPDVATVTSAMERLVNAAKADLDVQE
jgi:phosphoglucosamine mutase